MTQFITRAYNSFSFNFENSTITKHSKEQRLKQETEYYKSLPPELAIYFPRLVSSGFNAEKQEHFLELELYPYENLGKLLVGGKLSSEQWLEIASHINKILGEFKQQTLGSPLVDELKAMYLDKTQTEYQKLVEGFPTFKKLAEHKTITLNGELYENFSVVWPKILKKFEGKLIDASLTPSVIHGDFCFSNILVGFLPAPAGSPGPDGKSILRFVDPRGKFGRLTMFGDPYYDLAKLMHSTDAGYEYIIYDQFTIKTLSENSYELSYANANKEDVDKIFHDQLYSHYDLTRIKLIEATIYIGMCARHYDSEQRQLAMYVSGVRLLNELLK